MVEAQIALWTHAKRPSGNTNTQIYLMKYNRRDEENVYIHMYNICILAADMQTELTQTKGNGY